MRKLFVLFALLLLVLPVLAQDTDEMELPEAQTFAFGDIDINYYETEGEGMDIFFVHGNSMSGRSFANQMAMLGDEYHIVAIDLPGHGMSSAVAEDMATEVYNLPGYAEAVVALAEELDMTEGVFVGSSLGGHIVLEASDELPNAAGFMIYGTPPIAFPLAEDAFLASPGMGYVFTPELTDEDLDIWIAEVFSPDYEDYPEFMKEDMALTDGMARGSLGLSIAPEGYQDEVEIVANLETPLAILHGENELLVNLEYIESLEYSSLWMDEVQVLEDTGHYIHWETPELFNEVLLAFIDDVTMMDDDS